MKEQISPRPWRVNNRYGSSVNDAKHNWIGDENRANNELIVRAVNSHDALVDALREAQKAIKWLAWGYNGADERVNAYVARIEAALKAAGE